MSDRPKTPPLKSDSLQDAFKQLGKFQERLEDLKQKYNETAKETANLSQAVTTPVPPMLIEKPDVDGRYSISTPLKSERPGAMPQRPPVPRPTPRVTKETLIPPSSSRPSGRFYIQVSKGASTEELNSVREKLSKLGRIVDSGTGTASKPEAGWVEIAVRDSDVRDLINKLKNNELQECVEKVIEVEPGEGRIQARQMELFQLKMSVIK